MAIRSKNILAYYTFRGIDYCSKMFYDNGLSTIKLLQNGNFAIFLSIVLMFMSFVNQSELISVNKSFIIVILNSSIANIITLKL